MVWKGVRSIAVAIVVVCAVQAANGEAADDRSTGEGPQLTISRLVVEGNTALSDRRVAGFERIHRGRTVTLEELKAIADDLRRIYHRKGYVTTRVVVPAQEPTGRRVRLRVLEGRYGAIRVEGAEHFSVGPNYRAYLRRKGRSWTGIAWMRPCETSTFIPTKMCGRC
jgi:hemolysin activation/secretion protein